MNETETHLPSPRASGLPSPRVRIDVISTVVRRVLPSGVRLEIRPPKPVTAGWDQALPLFEGWMQNAEVCVRASGLGEAPFFGGLEIDGVDASRSLRELIRQDQLEDGFFVGDGHIDAIKRESGEGSGEILACDLKGSIGVVHFEGNVGGLMHHRREGVADGITDDCKVHL